MVKKGQYIWMAVESDEYELPICVADSIKELAELLGVTEQSIRSKYYEYKRRGIWCEYLRIPVNGDAEFVPYTPIKKPNTGIVRKKVLCHMDGRDVLFESVGDCAKFFGLSKPTISKYATRGYGKGYTWEWIGGKEDTTRRD